MAICDIPASNAFTVGLAFGATIGLVFGVVLVIVVALVEWANRHNRRKAVK